MNRTTAGTRTVAGTRSPSSLGNAKRFLGPSKGYINIAMNDITYASTDSFTWECQIKSKILNAQTFLGGIFKAGTTSSISISLNSSGFIVPFVRDEAGVNVGTISFGHSALNDNAFHHVALVVDGTLNKMRVYLDGVNVNGNNNYTRTGDILVGTSFVPFIGCRNNRGTADQYFQGVVDEIRFSNKVRYSSDFTPPASNTPYVVDANTQFLAHLNEQGTPIDSSSSPYTMSIVGNVVNNLGYFVDTSITRNKA